MADEANTPAPAELSKATEETTRESEPPTTTVGAAVAPGDATEEASPGEAAATAEPSTDPPASTANDRIVAETASEEAEPAAQDAPASATNGTPAKRGGNRRKSGAGVPEHNKKKTPGKKKAAVELRLNVQPGEFWFVAMRGFPPWPVVVCDEEMLPETLLSKRPVSAKRIDGTYREDFREGGKNAKDRRYPIMFMGTNEFSWQVNTDLQPLDVEEVRKEVEADKQGKKSKALWEAYKIAAEGHDLQWFKSMLEDHEKALQADVEEKLAAEAKKQEKKEKGKRKSVPAATEEPDDVEMDDAPEEEEDTTKKAKGSKKRKKSDESEGESEKPKKTPKTKLKLNNKTPKDSSTAKPKKQTTAKKTKSQAQSESEEAEVTKVEEKPMTPAELQEKREKSVLYLRHRLQKGFLTRDQPPKEEEMANMSDYFKQLEAYTDLEAEVIKKTKVHKVLKAIIKLNSIPKEEEHQFKKRSNDLLNNWKLALTADVETPTVADAPAAPAANGVKEEADVKDEAKEKTDAVVASTENSVEENADGSDVAKKDAEEDVTMADAKDESEKAETAIEATA